MVTDQPCGDGGESMLGLEDFASSAQGAKGANIKVDLVIHQGFNYVQSVSRNQHQGHGEGAEFGSVGVHSGSALKEGEDQVSAGNNGDDGMELEEGSRASSHSC